MSSEQCDSRHSAADSDLRIGRLDHPVVDSSSCGGAEMEAHALSLSIACSVLLAANALQTQRSSRVDTTTCSTEIAEMRHQLEYVRHKCVAMSRTRFRRALRRVHARAWRMQISGRCEAGGIGASGAGCRSCLRRSAPCRKWSLTASVRDCASACSALAPLRALSLSSPSRWASFSWFLLAPVGKG